MAEVYGRLTGRAGVCSATLGPGAINLLLGTADATTNSTPLIALSAQVGMDRSFKESHQGVDLVSMFAPVTKWSALVATPGAVPEMIRKAFKLAQTERPGAVYLAIPEDVEKAPAQGEPLPVNVPRPTSRPADRSSGRRRCCARRPARSCWPATAPRAPGRPGPAPLRRDAGHPGGDHVPRQGRVPRRPPAGPGRGGVHAARLRQLRLRPRRPDRRRRLRAAGVRPGPDQPATATRRSSTCTGFPPRWTRTTTWPSGCTPTSAAAWTRWPAAPYRPRPAGAEPAAEVRIRSLLAAELARGQRDDRFPLAPARIVADTRAALRRDDIVLVDTGALKMWMARLYPTYEPNTCLISNGLSTMAWTVPGRDRREDRPAGLPGAGRHRRRRLPDELPGDRDRAPPGARLRHPDLGRRRLRADQLEDGPGDRAQRGHEVRQPGLRRATPRASAPPGTGSPRPASCSRRCRPPWPPTRSR